MNEYDIKMDEAFGQVLALEKQINRMKTKISENDPFGLMVELAESQKIVRDTMHFAIEAQEEFIKPIKQDAQRIA